MNYGGPQGGGYGAPQGGGGYGRAPQQYNTGGAAGGYPNPPQQRPQQPQPPQPPQQPHYSNPSTLDDGKRYMKPQQMPQQDLAGQNMKSWSCAIVNNSDFKGHPQVFPLRIWIEKDSYVVNAFQLSSQHVNPGVIRFTGPVRKWLKIPQNFWFDIPVMDYEPPANAQDAIQVEVKVGHSNIRMEVNERFDPELVKSSISDVLDGMYVSQDQFFTTSCKNFPLRVMVSSIIVKATTTNGLNEAGPKDSLRIGPSTVIKVVPGTENPIKMTASETDPSPGAVIDIESFDTDSLDVGGLDNELHQIIRRAFLSRCLAPGVLERLGLEHLKGILLYGPPGTGKTLIARQLSSLLKVAKPKIVNGPDILSKWVGESEKNIRELFAPAEKEAQEAKKEGRVSATHVIVFDEIDAICKSRGSGGAGGTGVTDNIVNQLLTKMDGVEQLDNILIIGMTNRKDLIDPALLRPGRFELQIEIPLPDEAGRLSILRIVLKSAKKYGYLAVDNNDQYEMMLQELASLTRNFTGAELKALWKTATSYAQESINPIRGTKNYELSKANTDLKEKGEIKVGMEHFIRALEDVQPMHGAKTSTLRDYIAKGYGIVDFSPSVKGLLNTSENFKEEFKEGRESGVIYPVLVRGTQWSGHGTMAASIALAVDAPFTQMVRSTEFIGMNAHQVIEKLRGTFELAYKSTESMLVIDSIEDILGWIAIGPRFSTDIVLALKGLLRQEPPHSHRLGVIITTNNESILRAVGLTEVFREVLTMPVVRTQTQLHNVLNRAGISNNNVVAMIWNEIESANRGQTWKLGVELVLDAARKRIKDTQNPSREEVSSFVQYLADAMDRAIDTSISQY